MVDKIKGGLADSKTLDDIAEKHGVTLSAIESALADGIKVEQEHTDDVAVATEIAKDHLFEDAEYYSKLANMERQNEKNWVTIDGNHVLLEKEEKKVNPRVAARKKYQEALKKMDEAEKAHENGEISFEEFMKIETEYKKEHDLFFKVSEEKTNSKDWAKTYKASNFIEKGVCTYNDETIYLSQSTLERAMRSMKGRPVVVKHQKVTPQNMQDHAVGYVTDSGQFDSFDAGFTCPFIVFDDEGKEVIAKDYSVSCAYIPKAFGIGGTWHNTPYDREVTELEFTHLALVPDPRYEDAKIYENAMDEDVSDEDRWITIGAEEGHKGKKILIKAGQTVDEAIKDKFSEWAGKSKDQQSLFDKKEYAPDKDSYKKKKEAEKVAKEQYKQKSFEKYKKHIENLKVGDILKTTTDSKPRYVRAVDGDQIYISKHRKEGISTIVTKKSLIDKYGDLYEMYNSKDNDNTTKENYNMEKIEVEQGFLASLIELAQKPFLNSKKEEKEEPKEKEDVKVDDDEMEYEGKKYSKKELVNAFIKGEAKPEVKEEKEKTNAVEEEVEEVVEQPTNDDMEFFNSMQALMATANTDADDKIVVHSQNKGLELGSKAFG